MLFFPQLTTGAVAQYPSMRSRRLRSVVNTMAGGAEVKFAVPSAGRRRWRLEYAHLSDEERVVLEDFFHSCRGSLETFTFLDPVENLLRWSENMSQSVWQCDPLLQVTVDEEDSFRLVNRGQTGQGIGQTLDDMPEAYTYCLSAAVRSTEPALITLNVSGREAPVRSDQAWQLVWCTAVDVQGPVHVRVGVEAGKAVQVRGVMLQPQPMPGTYRPSRETCGVKRLVRFDQQILEFLSHGVNDHSTTVLITTTTGE